MKRSLVEGILGVIHGMADQDTLVQVLLVDELFHVVCHDGVVVLLGMERVSMIPKILAGYRWRGLISCCLPTYLPTGRIAEKKTNHHEDLSLEITRKGSGGPVSHVVIRSAAWKFPNRHTC